MSSQAQESNLRKKKIAAVGLVKLDSLSVVPRSVYVMNTDTSYYFIDDINAILFWKKKKETDSVEVMYRVFPTRLNAVSQRFSYDSVLNNFMAQPSLFKQKINANENNLFNFGNLNYNGSFGRNLSFGNSQDAVFNSQFNLQLNGFIGDSIEIAAAITDNNIPIQPDGTTQRLNEFDRILIQFKKKNWEINLGDIDLRQNQSYFLNFYKRLQGISYQQQSKISQNIANKTLVSGAIAKGKFARNIIQTQEGNQGPYKLQGNNNEFYFIVLSGTEKVFIDGVLMQRGEDQDYIINYNTAEVSFTPKQMITKDKRVQVEFEYADRNYLNSMLYLNNETKFGNRLTLNISAYTNNDIKTSPINQTLSNNQTKFLSNIGDSIQNAFYPVSSIDSFSVSKILYKKIDTIYNGVHDSIYVYSVDPKDAKYNLSFIETGLNKGNYISLFNAANGKVYQWVRPLNGVPQGNYEAASFLVAPKKQQIISVGATYTINAKTTIVSELAASKLDINTFSKKDKGNDKGNAAKFSIRHTEAWKTLSGKSMHLLATGGYEWVNKNFQSIERIRPVEFARDWGLILIPSAATEQLPSVSLLLDDDKNNSLLYNFSSYLRSDGFKGYRNIVTHTEEQHNWHLHDVFNITNSNTSVDKGFYLRPSIDLNKTFQSLHNYILGASYALEHNEVRNVLTDTVTPLSFAFETVSAYIKSNPTVLNRWGFTYFTRSDKLPYQKKLAQYDRSHNYNFQTELLSNQNRQFKLNATYRQLYIQNSLLTSQQPDNSLLGRAEYLFHEGKGFITCNILYEMGAGQEQKRDFSYIEVPSGQGQYAWNDYNHDGIPQLNEFELAVFQDQAKYIRIYTPTNQYVKANYNQFNYSVYINPKVIAKSIKNKSIAGFIARFNLQSSLQTGKKQLSKGNPIFNPFKGKITDTSLINLNYIVSNTLSFNRSSSSWGADISNVQNYNKALLSYGFESRQVNEWIIKSRVNINRSYTLEWIQKIGFNNLFTPSFANRNYALQTWSAEPRFTFISGTQYRIQSGYQYMRKTNQQKYGGEKSVNHSLGIEGKYNAVSNTSITGKFTYSNIDFTGVANTTVSYIMLDGLLPGKNFQWTIDFTKRLINNLELSFQYEGRKPGEGHTIHVGRASLRALL